VILLVWKRLRDSLSKKLEYLHKNFLFKLYSDFSRPNFFWTQDEIKRLRSNLEKYGKFMVLRLYPRNFLNKIDEFLSLHGEFFKRYMEIEELAKKQVEPVDLHRDLLQECIGLKPDHRSSYVALVEEQYQKIAQNIIAEHPQIVSEGKEFLEKIRKLDKQVFEELEDFLKSNNLRLEEEISSARW